MVMNITAHAVSLQVKTQAITYKIDAIQHLFKKDRAI